MPYICKECGRSEAVKPKVCPGCSQKNKGWTLQATASSSAPTKDTSSVPEWDGAASAALAATSIIGGNTFVTLGSQNGLPSTACLNALYAAIKVPSVKKKGEIAFHAFAANYDNNTSKLVGTASIAAGEAFNIHTTAADCAERALWKKVGTKLSGLTLMGIGQTTRPCLLCCARFSALAASNRVTIMIYFEKGYDQLPGNTWLVFSPTVAATGYTS